MIAFSDHFTRMFLMIVNGLFIAIGVGMISVGIYQNVSGVRIEEDADDTPSGTVTIVTGCFDIIVGVCGLVGALLNKRILLMANASMLCIAVIGNITVLVVYSVILHNVTSNGKENMAKLIKSKYGNQSDPDGKILTKEIDDYHAADGCCGWSGIDGENLFISTPWYKGINANPRGAPFTLPDSCCIKTTDECHRTNNVKEAREKGFVLKFDCIDRINSRAQISGAMFLTQLAFLILLQISAVLFSVLYLKQVPPE